MEYVRKVYGLVFARSHHSLIREGVFFSKRKEKIHIFYPYFGANQITHGGKTIALFCILCLF